MLEKDIERVLVSKEDINEISKRLGAQVTKDYAGKQPLVVGLLNGCVPFLGHILGEIDLYIDVAFMDVSSYHGGTSSTGEVKILMDTQIPVLNRDIIIVEDIVDSGRTLRKVVDLFNFRGAKSVEVVTLLDKPLGRTVDFVPKYIGVTIPKEFVVGFGLDYEDKYRNLPYVGILKPEVYSK